MSQAGLTKRVAAFPARSPRPVFIDDEMIDWFLDDPLAAAEFLRQFRVQVLHNGSTEPVSIMILTRDSIPGLGLAC